MSFADGFAARLWRLSIPAAAALCRNVWPCGCMLWAMALRRLMWVFGLLLGVLRLAWPILARFV